ncbi:hypothetical protein IWX76_001947 [Pedobacter sp. CAN_A7]|uniref:hypothetical protein n=1 Tax=Pedobacter sp. CAN_A7 TaxID=2787722 RepID=UPI0018CADB17
MDAQRFNQLKWIRWSLLNLFVVALLGIALRYKINFSFPLVDQKYLLHGHSHFAFTGWVTLALMALMIKYLDRQHVDIDFKKYNWLLLATNIVAYGMLFTFIYQGYAFLSITFSTLSILISYLFIYCYWLDLRQIKGEPSTVLWFKAALIQWFLSSIGVFTLAYLMASGNVVQEWYFASIYFFLHFQYNGWFLFACFGLLFSLLPVNSNPLSVATNKKLFLILLITVVPTYILSVLWLKIPDYLYWIGVVSGIVQLAAIFYLIKLYQFAKQHLTTPLAASTTYLLILAWLSFVLKLVLQTLSIVPYLGQYAFSFRPIVVGYLHLCFLCIISFFIIGFFNQVLEKHGRKLNSTGVFLFIFGVLLQETVLMIQGLSAFQVHILPHAGLILFGVAIIIGLSLAIINRSLGKKIIH